MANESDEKSKRASEGDPPFEPASQRARRIESRRWLAPPSGGQRHTRIGDDFQVAILPTPNVDHCNEGKESEMAIEDVEGEGKNASSEESGKGDKSDETGSTFPNA